MRAYIHTYLPFSHTRLKLPAGLEPCAIASSALPGAPSRGARPALPFPGAATRYLARLPHSMPTVALSASPYLLACYVRRAAIRAARQTRLADARPGAATASERAPAAGITARSSRVSRDRMSARSFGLRHLAELAYQHEQ